MKKTRPEQTRIAGETEDEEGQEEEFAQVEGNEEDAEDLDDEEENDEQDEALDDGEVDIEPSSLVYESRLHPVSRSDLDFDQDAMYASAVR